MPHYRYSGKDRIAPDRGDPNGYDSPFKPLRFEAVDDDAARARVAAFKSDRGEVVAELLVRVEQEEHVSPVDLT